MFLRLLPYRLTDPSRADPDQEYRLFTTLLGFGLAIVGGVILGVLIGSSAVIYRAFYPLLIAFNYETEPLPGHFPTPFGLPLLRESRLNHLGKLMFQWIYWHALLPGREIPGIGPAMPTSGKSFTPAHA